MCIIHQSGQTYYNFFIPVVEYWLEEKIVGASMIDISFFLITENIQFYYFHNLFTIK